MFRRLISILMAVFFLAAPQAAMSAEHSDEQKEVLAAVDRFFAALKTRDVPAFREMMLEEGGTHILSAQDDGTFQLRHQPFVDFFDAIGRGTSEIDEPYWDPVVLIRGPLAVAWMPYQVFADGELIHCGVDSFTLVKNDGEWKFSYLAYTAEPNACDELQP